MKVVSDIRSSLFSIIEFLHNNSGQCRGYYSGYDIYGRCRFVARLNFTLAFDRILEVRIVSCFISADSGVPTSLGSTKYTLLVTRKAD